MKSIVFTAFIVACIAGVGASWPSASSLQEKQGPVIDRRKFMQKKVDHAKNIVEALATENYEAITKNAQDLLLLSMESNWNAFQTPEYIELSREFRIVAERLRETGREKNIDSATLGYMELTMSCVRCHKYLRQKKN